VRVELMTRPGCHLCEEAREELDAHIAALGAAGGEIDVVEVDIEADDELHRRYLERIPVILVDGEPVSELGFDPAAFDDRLQRRAEHSR